MPFLGNQPAEGYRSIDKQTITGTGATVYTLTHKVASANDVEVFVNNVRQEPGVAYTCSGNQITFTTAVESSDDCYIVFQGRAVTSNVIESQNIADGAITAAKTDFNVASSHMMLPKGTTAQRPSSPQNGYIRYNTDEDYLEEYRNGSWEILSNIFVAGGGTITESGGYRYHTFTESGNFTISSGSTSAEYLIIAGGGGGVDNTAIDTGGGGGGAGGLIYSTATLTAAAYTVTVGAGGSPGSNGANSSFNSETAIGGGRGSAYSSQLPGDGGSGGGGTYISGGVATAGSGTVGQGNDGGEGGWGEVAPSQLYAGGGGGGAGAVGQNSGVDTPADYGGNGGNGLDYSTWATATSTGDNGYYAGGGGGAARDPAYVSAPITAGSGGLGGGGDGSGPNNSWIAQNGQANTGGGAGGASSSSTVRSGGSGIVIIRYAI
jgi:hypothetical protein